MTQRGPGFKSLEDVILCNVYILHSTDSEIGPYQRKKDLWAKIESSYNQEAVDARRLERRNVKSLYARWEKISSACTLFRECITQEKSQYKSGSSEVDTIKNAKDLYVIKEPKHQTFRFDHAWDILKYHEKWNEPLLESSHANDLWQEMMNSFAKSQELMEKQCADNLAINQSKEAQANILVELEQRKLEYKQKKLAKKQQQLAIRQQEMEMRAAEKDIEIMNKDLSNLTPFSKEFWTRKKRAIIRNVDIPRVARNLNFSAGGSGESNEDVYVPSEYTGGSYYQGNEEFPDLNNDT